MTATLAPPTYSSDQMWAGRQVLSVDLWFPGRQDGIGKRGYENCEDADPLRYIAWVRSDSHRGGLQPRLALHVMARP